MLFSKECCRLIRELTGTMSFMFSTDTMGIWCNMNPRRDDMWMRWWMTKNGTDSAGSYYLSFQSAGGGLGISEPQDIPFMLPIFYLYQNSPNPFNPTTKIKYSIKNVETHGYPSVKLKVVDVLALEVTTLVNESKKPGEIQSENLILHHFQAESLFIN